MLNYIFFCVLICVNTKAEVINDNITSETNDQDSITTTTTYKTDLDERSHTLRSHLPPDLNKIFRASYVLPEGLCKNESQIVMEAVLSRENWALQMFDSSPKFPVGILYGSHFQLGNFDECVEARQPEEPHVLGQYCLADVVLYPEMDGERYARSHDNFYSNQLNSDRLSFNKTLSWAICVPSSCKANDVQLFLTEIIKTAISSKPIKIEVANHKCHYDKETPLTTLEILYATAIGSFVVIVLLATLYHIQLHQRNRNRTPSEPTVINEVILSFSLIKSVQKLLHVRASDFDLEFISGIKFITMLLIISSHALVFVMGGPITNEEFYLTAVTKVQNSIFVNHPLLVEVFLLLSGFLMCRILLLELDKRKGQINILVIYIGRYIRLTPAYAVVIGLYCTYLVRLDKGPLWDSVLMKEQERCLTSWWSNILYINNYVNTDSICMFQSWYLSADTQLFMIAPFIIYPLYKWPRKGQILLALSTIAAVVTPFAVTYIYKLDPTFMGYPIELTDLTLNRYYVFAYIKTHMRAIAYCIGLTAGYLVHKIVTSNIKLGKSVVFGCWLLATIFGISSVFSIVVFYQSGYEYNVLEASLYAPLHKLAWSLSIGWLIIACVTDNAGPIKAFLSWAPFSPLSRLTYCAYLMNGVIELHSIGTVRTANYTSIYDLAVISLAHFVLTFVCGLILCVFFESPIHSIEKLILKQESKYRSRRKNLEDSSKL